MYDGLNRKEYGKDPDHSMDHEAVSLDVNKEYVPMNNEKLPVMMEVDYTIQGQRHAILGMDEEEKQIYHSKENKGKEKVIKDGPCNETRGENLGQNEAIKAQFCRIAKIKAQNIRKGLLNQKMEVVRKGGPDPVLGQNFEEGMTKLVVPNSSNFSSCDNQEDIRRAQSQGNPSSKKRSYPVIEDSFVSKRIKAAIQLLHKGEEVSVQGELGEHGPFGIGTYTNPSTSSNKRSNIKGWARRKALSFNKNLLDDESNLAVKGGNSDSEAEDQVVFSPPSC